VQLSFQEYHRSEKLRRIHQLSSRKEASPAAGLRYQPAPVCPRIARPGDLTACGRLYAPGFQSAPCAGGTGHPNEQRDWQKGVRPFQVPPASAHNRFFTSFNIQATNAGRAAPEYAHIRFHVRPNGQLFDVNSLDTHTTIRCCGRRNFTAFLAWKMGH